MIYYIKGELVALYANYAAVDVSGVAYKASISYNTYLRIQNKKNVLLYTYMSVREDAVELYGFHDENELELFQKLITVSGVGPKAALSVLSSMTPERLYEAVEAEDTKLIARAQGLGPKTAARIVLELKGKLSSFGSGEKTVAAVQSSAELVREAEQALVVLGYTKQEAAKAVAKVAKPGDTVEDMIKNALGALMR